MISLGYLYLFLHERQLSWENIQDDITINDSYSETSIYHYKNIIRQKMKQTENVLLKAINIEPILHNYLKYVYNLDYDELPNYNALAKMFQL